MLQRHAPLREDSRRRREPPWFISGAALNFPPETSPFSLSAQQKKVLILGQPGQAELLRPSRSGLPPPPASSALMLSLPASKASPHVGLKRVCSHQHHFLSMNLGISGVMRRAFVAARQSEAGVRLTSAAERPELAAAVLQEALQAEPLVVFSAPSLERG